MVLQIGIVLYIYTITIFRRNLSVKVKQNSMIAILMLIGFSSIATFGFSTDAMSFLIVAQVLTCIMAGTRTAVKLAITLTLSLVIAGIYHCTHPNSIPFDINFLVHDTSTWVSAIVSFSMVTLALAIAVGTLHESHAALIDELNKKNKEVMDLAHTDYLTGLKNRRIMEDRLGFMIDRQHRHPGKIFIFYMDLDGFKAVNDTHTHAAGDQVLKVIANRLVKNFRPEDVVARIGGDEFVAVVQVDEGSCVSKYAEDIATRIIEEIQQPITWEKHIINVSASVGIVEYDQAKRIDATTLMDIADAAMFSIKKSGKNGFIIQKPIFTE